MTDWFRSWHGAPTDPKWRTIARRATEHRNVTPCNAIRPGDVAAVMWTLLDRASQAPERGSIAGYDPEVIADALGYEVDEVEAIIYALIEKGVISKGDVIANWLKYQPKREREDPGSSGRVREHRAMAEHVTPGNATQHHETPCNATERLDKSREEEKREERKDSSSLRSEPRARRKNPVKVPIDPNYAPNETTQRVNAECGYSPSDLADSTERMKSWALSEGAMKADWNATHQNWIRRNAERRDATGPPVNGQPRTAAPINGSRHDLQANRSVHLAIGRIRASLDSPGAEDHSSGGREGQPSPRLLSGG